METAPGALPQREVWVVLTRSPGREPAAWDPKATGSLERCLESIVTRRSQFSQPFEAAVVGLRSCSFALGPVQAADGSPGSERDFWAEWTLEGSPILWKVMEAAARHAIHMPTNQPQE